MEKEIMKKIEAQQGYITTNEDLSEYGYVKAGFNMVGIQKWWLSKKVAENNAQQNRKGGKYYEHALKYNRTGLSGARSRIRVKHAKQYRPYKAIIAPGSQIHHQWEEGTANYTGIALVEADAHQHGNIRVIEVLNGEITLFKEPGIG